ncbi:MAG: DNA-binding response regulator [Desulfobulbus sp.]|nr:MAG: DNA-binding response regulator [Desulfobulbus sp.]
MTKPNILVVEDDADIQQLVSYNLIKAGMHVTCADQGEEALAVLEREKIDGVILDLMLPGQDGLEVCRRIREQKETSALPVIILTAKSEDDDVITGLDTGADDYVTKPFSPKVLIARLLAVMRRKGENRIDSDNAADREISLHGLTIHPGRHEVHLLGRPVRLTGTEFTILHILAARPGWVFTRQQIIDRVRGYEYLITPRAVDVQIFGLRKKLGKAGQLLETVRGLGYRMKE